MIDDLANDVSSRVAGCACEDATGRLVSSQLVDSFDHCASLA